MDGPASNGWSSQLAAALPEALEEAALLAVRGHRLRCQEIKLHHLHALSLHQTALSSKQ